MIKFTCPNCGIQMHVPASVQGRPGLCFGCGMPLAVPASSAVTSQMSLSFVRGTEISGRYVIDKLLGKGGMGVVYLAQDKLVNEDVALKFLNPRMLRTQKGQALFINEAQIARRLRHEHIVAVHDVTSTDEGVMYLSMEFLKGQSLRSFLRTKREERKLVEVRLVVSLVSQILAALEYAHRTVIHRDIKPENAMLLPGEVVKVLDFGLAKVVEDEIDPHAVPGKKGRIVGTRAYASPEQLKHHTIDLRTDIYSVGLVFYELLTLRTPLDDPVNVPDVRNDVSPSMLEVLQRSLRMNKEERWPSAGEYRRNLMDAFEESYRANIAPEIITSESVEVSTKDMVFMEGGSFLMGNDDVRVEFPEHEVHVAPFFIDKHPVTVSEYERFLKDANWPEPKFWHGSSFDGPNQPVVGVTWADANAYAAWAGKSLPTEQQWEFSARGKQNRKYPWGNHQPDSVLSNFADSLGMPSTITMYEDGATPEGICDMAGNVYEWTLGYFARYGPETPDAQAKSAAPLKVVRGGCWQSPADDLRCAHRKGLFPESRLTIVGFRCVAGIQE